MKMASREVGLTSQRASQRAAALLVLSLAAFGGCGGGGSSEDPAGPEASPGAVDPDGDGPLAPTGPRLDESAGPGIGANSGGGEDGFVADERSTPGVLSTDTSCAASVLQAETIERVVEVPIVEEVVVPSVFYLMLDSSGSMVSDPFTLEGLIEEILDIFGLGTQPPQPTKWDYAVDGLKQFMSDPATQGVELGLGYFPDGGLCDGSGYDVPQVALGAVPGNVPALEASLDSRVPNGGTPLEGALRGVTNFCLEFNASRSDAACVAVLITDGAAEECSARSADDLASIARSAAEQGVITYAAGMEGADFSVLDAIGQASGVDCDPDAPGFACDLTADRDAFVRALGSIVQSARTQIRTETHIEREVTTVPCQWEIPPPPAGEMFDAALVNVEVSATDTEPRSVLNVAAEADCGTDGGWYYDDPAAPTIIHACPATCEVVQATPDTRVNLLFGCATEIR